MSDAGSRVPGVGRALADDLEGPLASLRARRPDLALDVRWHESLPSTMDVAAAAAESGSSRGLVVVADEQTAGRGRRGHEWSSPLGAGLYFSSVARLSRHVSLLTLAAGVAVRQGILQATGLCVDLEWPNDLVTGGRKLAGILAEGLRVSGPVATVIIGVGINVRAAAYPPDVAFRATSIEAELGRAVDRGAVLAAVLECLHDHVGRLASDHAEGILREWRSAAPSSTGARVEWETPGGVMSGTTAGVDTTGALLVRTPQGTERIIAGEVRWLCS
jgi:BirA family biotin operon repressor/biotin-[acetyl-CoA-carboxylase] ligase